MTVSWTNGASIYKPTKSEFDEDWNYQHVILGHDDHKSYFADAADIATLLNTDLWTLVFALQPDLPDTAGVGDYFMGGSSTAKVRIYCERRLISGTDYTNRWRFYKYDDSSYVRKDVTETSFFSTAEAHAARNEKKYWCVRSDTTNGVDIFLNDILNKTTEATWNTATSTISGTTYIGSHTADNAGGWGGKLGDWYFYDRKLTDAEVTELFDNYKTRYGSVQE